MIVTQEKVFCLFTNVGQRKKIYLSNLRPFTVKVLNSVEALLFFRSILITTSAFAIVAVTCRLFQTTITRNYFNVLLLV